MRQSKLFTKTVKEVSSEIKIASHRLLNQAGFVKESTAGRYFFLPLGIRVREKISKVIEEEMNKVGALKLITPVLHPMELWQETNRNSSVGFELMKIKDRAGAEFVLGGTAEEMMVDLVRKYNISYKDLPFNIYQFSQKFRDELRARGGLLRVREFLMKDAYSFHADEEDFKIYYQEMSDVYTKIFKRLGLETVIVESDNGYIGGDYCHEFVVISEIGESRFLISVDGKYAAHEDVAKFKKEDKNLDEAEKAMIEVEAVRGKTMEDGVKFHNMSLWQQLKDVMYVDDQGRFILAIIRGDLDVNETKLLNLVKATSLRSASEEEIQNLGSEPGFISPVGLEKKVVIVADSSLRTIKNAYGGSNKKNVDLLNVNIDRDYKAQLEGDIAMAQDGFLSESGVILKESKGIEVGNIFQLGYHYSKKMKAMFVSAENKEEFYYMGCYGIGVDRTMATIVEKYNDDKGIIWPEEIAPFKIHLIELASKNVEVKNSAEKLYQELLQNNIEVLYDDRTDLRAGEKFADSDLVGVPYRLVISEKTLAQGCVEVKKRGSEGVEMVKIEDVLGRFK
jgi:prolyl-tRNA synthetase